MDEAVAQAPRSARRLSVVGQRTGIDTPGQPAQPLAAVWPESWPVPSVWVNSPRHGLPRHDPWVHSEKFTSSGRACPAPAAGVAAVALAPIERLRGPRTSFMPASTSRPSSARRGVTGTTSTSITPPGRRQIRGRYFLETFPRVCPRRPYHFGLAVHARELLPLTISTRTHTVIHSGVDRQRFNRNHRPRTTSQERFRAASCPHLLCVATLERARTWRR